MMKTTAPSERCNTQPQTCVTITTTETEKQKQSSKLPCAGVRLRAPIVANTLIVIIVALLLAILEFGVIPQKKLGFWCKDPKISYLYKGETVSMTTLLASSSIIPLLVIVFIESLKEETFKKVRLSNVWLYYKEYLIGVTLILFLTEVAKVVIGEPRPHFLETCQPNVSCVEGTFIEDYECTNSRYSWYFINDASRSFPSGHAAATSFVALFCSHVVNRGLPTRKTGRLLKPLLIALLFTYSVFCSLTRITDRRHHWWDVCAGAVLGLFGALYAIKVLEDRTRDNLKPPRTTASTINLVDEKNKDATSICL